MGTRMGALVGAWLWAAGYAAGVPGAVPPAGQPDGGHFQAPPRQELALHLAQREAELAALRSRLAELEALDERRWYAQARALALLEELTRYGLTRQQAYRVAVTVVRQAHANNLDPLLVMAVIRCESAFNPYAVSGPGAMGLMQVMPATGKWLAAQRGFALGKARNLFDIELNIELGTAYLSSLLSRFGSHEHALVAYNAGPGAAKHILANPEQRRRFLAGYPRHVLDELARLRQRVLLTDVTPEKSSPDPAMLTP